MFLPRTLPSGAFITQNMSSCQSAKGHLNSWSILRLLTIMLVQIPVKYYIVAFLSGVVGGVLLK